MKESSNPISGETLGVHEESELESAKREGQEFSEYMAKRGPRFELPKNRPDLLELLRKELANSRTELVEKRQILENDERTKFQAPEIRFRSLNKIKYKADFISYLLVDGHVNTYEFSLRYPKSTYDLESFEQAIREVAKLLEMDKEPPKIIM